MADLKFEIKKNLGVIGQSLKGWKKELNLVSWNEREPRMDIREWDEEHKRMGKGVTLNKQEFSKLKELINDVDTSAIG